MGCVRRAGAEGGKTARLGGLLSRLQRKRISKREFEKIRLQLCFTAFITTCVHVTPTRVVHPSSSATSFVKRILVPPHLTRTGEGLLALLPAATNFLTAGESPQTFSRLGLEGA